MGSPDSSIEHQMVAGWSGDTDFDAMWPNYSPYADPEAPAELPSPQPVTPPLSLKEEAVTLQFQLANAEALLDETAGRLLDAEAAFAGAQNWADSLLDTIRTAHEALVAAEGTISTVALRNGMAAATEALGRILDPTSEDIGEAS